MFSDDNYFPQYVLLPVDFWLNVCHRARVDVDMYSDDFILTFDKSDFFGTCKKTVKGKLQWKEWSDCSVSCGGGLQTKIASSCVPDYAICYEIPILERNCNEHVCQVGQWTWNDWSECTKTCGGGIRIKTADQCSPEGASCEEVPIIKESCNEDSCPQGQWNWNPWSDCTVSCGGGLRTRTPNSCVPETAICEEVSIQVETCNEDLCPTGTWIWSEWGDCSVSCGGGVRTRIPRSCEPRNAICKDIPIIEESCNIAECPDTPLAYLPVRV